MGEQIRICTFNLENFDDRPDLKPTLAERIAIMRPQLIRSRADILCLQEVNGQGEANHRTLSALDQLLDHTPYAAYQRIFTSMVNSAYPYEERNLVTISRLPILQSENLRHSPQIAPSYRRVTAVPDEAEAKIVEWERPILYAGTDLGSNRTLHLFNLHLKSKIPSNIPGQKIDDYTWRTASAWAEGCFISTMKRLGQALQLRRKVDELFTQAEGAGAPLYIAIVGDFNDELDSVTLDAIRGPVEETGNPELSGRVIVSCEMTIPKSSRYSLFHLGQGQMIDHILASRALMTYYQGAEIHNEILPDESGAFRTDVKFPESDHAPVVAVFLLP